MSSRETFDPPERLIDPDGEGVYVLSGAGSMMLHRAALDLLGDAREWRKLGIRTVFMRPKGDGSDEWIEFKPRIWDWYRRKRNRPVIYLYCTPPAEPCDA